MFGTKKLIVSILTQIMSLSTCSLLNYHFLFMNVSQKSFYAEMGHNMKTPF